LSGIRKRLKKEKDLARIQLEEGFRELNDGREEVDYPPYPDVYDGIIIDDYTYDEYDDPYDEEDLDYPPYPDIYEGIIYDGIIYDEHYEYHIDNFSPKLIKMIKDIKRDLGKLTNYAEGIGPSEKSDGILFATDTISDIVNQIHL
jgi:hypothetical protein